MTTHRVSAAHAPRRNRTRHLLPILALPGNVVLLIPAIITWLGGTRGLAWGHPWLLLPAALCLANGLTLFGWSVWLFHTRGNGTLAPWHPPQHLVIAGPYRHVRNPMISGIFFLLGAETLVLGSVGVACWLGLFAAAQLFYVHVDEEPTLVTRFGDDYEEYRRHVPAWWPSLRGWPRLGKL